MEGACGDSLRQVKRGSIHHPAVRLERDSQSIGEWADRATAGEQNMSEQAGRTVEEEAEGIQLLEMCRT